MFCFPDFSRLFLVINVQKDSRNNKSSIESGLKCIEADIVHFKHTAVYVNSNK